ncbi:hypothetical protein I302_103948 [Kwoniella bestiolae CBS 10118]|uniref:Myb-like domain-containing protein n=1 Tax=Kwoniella bestiolae CBS 10118 TaxID=1296100 RepID=A0A1B9G9U0_9TREE|nr:hypothetical protein I302_02654 [Kwoniella bestiolae CBS 10118]OCF27805.1 hypothetical protein I302_02654 [Kwoniella bestiolae CBS 10118]
MPKTPNTPKSTSLKPYTPSPSPLNDTKPTITTPKSKTPTGGSSPSNRRPWSNEEFTQLFDHVMKNGAAGKKVWESAVQGRTANQAYLAWQQTLAPFLRAAIETRRGR